MSDEQVNSRILGMTLREPGKAVLLTKPKVLSIRCELEFTRATAEEMFKAIVFDEGDETVFITEVLRPAKVGEPHTFFHTGCGVGFCVDHYEFEEETL